MSSDSTAPLPPKDFPAPKAEPLPFNIYAIQPGGGRIMSMEIGWGKIRRWWLKTFFPKYVAASKARLKGDPTLVPHEVIDSRDLKYFRNLANCSFDPPSDIFAWRKNIPMATDGFFELLVFAAPPLVIGHLIYWYLGGWWNLITVPLVVFGLFVISFFRDPHRLVPTEEGAIVSPADGKVVDIQDVVHSKVGHGPVVRIGIFLSVFNVHVNRAPMAGRVLSLKYRQGEFLDARNRDAAERNENLEVVFAEPSAPYRKFAVRQVAGAIARRIVCELRPDQTVERGQRYGMIKFGSRTELYLPSAAVDLDVRIGDKVTGGVTVLGKWLAPTPEDFKPPKPKEKAAPVGPPPVEMEKSEPPPIPLAGDSPAVVTLVPKDPEDKKPAPEPGYGLASS
jgi:phosphatidylserine decarboxylase